MIENNNLKICRRLVRREFQFHKGRSILLTAAIALVSMLCTFSFSLGFMVYDGLVYNYQIQYGSTSHMIYYGLNSTQAAAIAGHADVRKTVLLRAVGVLSDDMMEYRNVKLAAVAPGWAESTEAVPVCGRMPEHDGEIALDELTMQSLAVPRKEGAEVTLRWTPVDGSKERVDTFRLCGWWNSNMGATETCAWISQETADRLCPDTPDSVTLGVTLYRPDDLDAQAEKILRDLGMAGTVYTTNLAFNEVRMDRVNSKTVKFFWVNIAVMVCGILMVYSVIRISAGQNVRFYGRIKSLGMSPRQIRRFLSSQTAYLCLPAILAGWIPGFVLYMVTAPYVILGAGGLGGENPALQFFSLKPFVCSGLLSWLTTWAACALPARFVGKISPVRAMAFYDGSGTRGKKRRGNHRRTGLVHLALSGFARSRGHAALAAGSLLFSLSMLCVLWTQYVSIDVEKYLEDSIYSDYVIADASAVTGLQRYNPVSCSITPEILQELENHEAVTGIGTIRTMEVPMYADEEERAGIVESFEGRNEEGIVRKEVMADSPDWLAGYEKYRETGAYIGIATGLDGLALETALEEGEYVEGFYDPERFATGKYVVASGASDVSFVSTPPVGSRVEIGGRFFEVMAGVSYRSRMLTGSDSRAAQFNVSYYMPVQTYEELFPGSGIRNVMVNIDLDRQEEFEEFLAELTGDTGIGVEMRSGHVWNFQNARFHNYIIPMFVGSVLLLIGILNFANALVTGMIVRKKELAIYESLGMSGRQIRRLFLLEGMLHGGVQIFILVPVVSVVTWFAGRWWVVHSSVSWCATWKFSLLPMWIVLPVLAGIAATVPLCCLHVIMEESVTQRLRCEQ
ncbi:MAG: hypothetical protein HFI57_09995 [Lachnospiraceae bacterium]|nr:hypothetical protein [Lachnospiraceae bacterium]